MWYYFLIVSVIIALIALKCYLRVSTKWNNTYTCLVGKTVIVTGANTGIGFYTALDLAARGARVILACRNKKKSEEARKRIIKATDNKEVYVKIVDFTSLKSVRYFAKDINETEERLDMLINNAGASGLENILTEDGLNVSMQVNHFGPFLLTLLLLDLLKKSAPSRVVNVSSVLACFANLDPDNLDVFPKKTFGTFRIYPNSKLCNILFTNELARRLRGTNILVNSVHPGACQTEIFRYLKSGLAFSVLKLIVKYYYKTPEEGAQTTIFVATSKDLDGITGEYFDNCRIGWFPFMPRTAHDGGLARIVWERSEELVKLSDDERILPGNPVIVVTNSD